CSLLLLYVLFSVDTKQALIGVCNASVCIIQLLTLFHLLGRELTESELDRVANYLRCKKVYLLNRNISEADNNVCKKSETDSSACLSDKELVIDILSRIPANEDYKYLQVMISRIIAENLKRNGIYQEDLIACGMAQKKVIDLFESSSNNEKILAFNNSDLLRIIHNFRVGYDLIFTGV
ncbi:MAG: hypothetical protein K2J73_05305, partial [Oscillospiraceae bacterium]|nr:hypothetical protein [Oscillospiraceae bacterium]